MNDPATRAGASIAIRPKVRYGGDNTNSTNAEGEKRSGGPGRLVAQTGSPVTAPTRRDNILTARADGSFDAKRNAFNAGTAQHGRTMDEAGNITGSAAPAPRGQLVPGRSAGSMVWQPSAANPSAPPAVPAVPSPPATAVPAPASPASNTQSPPAPAPPPGGIRPSSPSAPAPRAGTGPLRAPAPGAQTTALMGRINQSMSGKPAPTISAPPPPSPAVPPPGGQEKTPARKPGMINDGQGFRPASEVNAGLRAAQEARTANPAPPTAPAHVPGSAEKALAEFNKANPNVKSWQEQRQMQEQYQKNRENLAAIQARNKASPAAASKPSPPPTPIKPVVAVHPNTASGKPRHVPPGSLVLGR